MFEDFQYFTEVVRKLTAPNYGRVTLHHDLIEALHPDTSTPYSPVFSTFDLGPVKNRHYEQPGIQIVVPLEIMIISDSSPLLCLKRVKILDTRQATSFPSVKISQREFALSLRFLASPPYAFQSFARVQ